MDFCFRVVSIYIYIFTRKNLYDLAMSMAKYGTSI